MDSRWKESLLMTSMHSASEPAQHRACSRGRLRGQRVATKKKSDRQENRLHGLLRTEAWWRLPPWLCMVQLYSLSPFMEMLDHDRKLQSRLWAQR